MLFKICTICGAKYKIGTQCPNGCSSKAKKERDKRYDINSRDKTSYAIYHSKGWQKLTELCKAKFNGLDIYQLYKYKKIIYGNVSHHVIPIKDDNTRIYDIDNLIYLSNASHSEIHKEYDTGNKEQMQEYLFKLIKQYKADYIDTEGDRKKF
jgi:hypothetical protein